MLRRLARIAMYVVLSTGFGCSGVALTADDRQSVETSTREWVIEYWTEPSPIPLNQMFALYAEVYESDGITPADGCDLAIFATMPAHGHGMTTDPSITAYSGFSFEADGMLFHMEEQWEIQFWVTDDWMQDVAVVEIDCCDA